MSYETDIEQGLNFARARLAQELNDPDADPSQVADLALATLALVAARDARRRERPAILKTTAFSARRPEPVRASSYDETAPATINFERAAAAVAPRRSARDSDAPCAAQSAPCLRLYRGE